MVEMESSDMVLCLAFMSFLAFMAYIMITKPTVTPTYVQIPSLVQRPQSLGA